MFNGNLIKQSNLIVLVAGVKYGIMLCLMVIMYSLCSPLFHVSSFCFIFYVRGGPGPILSLMVSSGLPCHVTISFKLYFVIMYRG